MGDKKEESSHLAHQASDLDYSSFGIKVYHK